MIDIDDIHSLSEFRRNTKKHVSRLKRTGKPEILTVNGKAALVVVAAGSFQALAQSIEYAEAVKGIRQGLAEAKAGKGRALKGVVKRIRRKHRLPHHGYK